MRTLALLSAALLFAACSTEPINNGESSDLNSSNSQSTQTCTDEPPRARLTNNGTVPHSVEIYDMNYNLLADADNIAPGITTEWLTFSPQEVIFSIENDTFQDEKVVIVMETCMEFDMEIGSDDLLVSTYVNGAN